MHPAPSKNQRVLVQHQQIWVSSREQQQSRALVGTHSQGVGQSTTSKSRTRPESPGVFASHVTMPLAVAPAPPAASMPAPSPPTPAVVFMLTPAPVPAPTVVLMPAVAPAMAPAMPPIPVTEAARAPEVALETAPTAVEILIGCVRGISIGPVGEPMRTDRVNWDDHLQCKQGHQSIILDI
jgi:hypothetical protein